MRMILFALFLISFIFVPATHASDRNFYEGKTIRVLLGTAPNPGSGLELNARIVMKHMIRHIPGSPNFVVSNAIGGTGITATNLIDSDREGTVIGFPLPNILMLGFLKNDSNINFSSETINWIGTSDSLIDDAYVLVTRNEIENDFSKVIVGDTSETKIFDIPSIFHRVLARNSKVVYGYKTKDEVVLAFQRNETNSFSIIYSNLLNRYNPNEMFAMSRPILQFGHKTRISAFPNVPTFYEVAENDEQRKIIEFLQTVIAISKPIHVGKNVEQWKVDILRAAFDKTCRDEQFISEMKKFNFPVSCLGGTELQSLVSQTYNNMKEVRPLIDRYFRR